MTNRRQFLQAILAAGCAPAIVRASSLMPIYVVKESPIIFPALDLSGAKLTHWMPYEGAQTALFDMEIIKKEIVRAFHVDREFLVASDNRSGYGRVTLGSKP